MVLLKNKVNISPYNFTSKKFFNFIQNPPPWVWFYNGTIFKRYGKRSIIYFIGELVQQIVWIFSFFPRLKKFKLFNLNLTDFLWANFLNSYNYKEINKWQKINLNNSRNVNLPLPSSITWALHYERRSKKGEMPLEEFEILTNKAKTYKKFPGKYRPEYVVIKKSNKVDFNCLSKFRNIFKEYLQSSGIILKPLNGYGSNNIFYFKLKGNYLTYQNLFRDTLLINKKVNKDDIFKYISELFFDYTKNNDNVLVTPYIKNNSNLPETFPSTVIRVITKRDKFERLSVDFYYLEIPLANNKVVVVGPNGKYLPFFEFSNYEKIFIQKFFTALNKNKFLKECFSESINFHQIFSVIDQVAWDWIISDKGPILLEGNYSFGLTNIYLLKNI